MDGECVEENRRFWMEHLCITLPSAPCMFHHQLLLPRKLRIVTPPSEEEYFYASSSEAMCESEDPLQLDLYEEPLVDAKDNEDSDGTAVKAYAYEA